MAIRNDSTMPDADRRLLAVGFIFGFLAGAMIMLAALSFLIQSPIKAVGI